MMPVDHVAQPFLCGLGLVAMQLRLEELVVRVGLGEVVVRVGLGEVEVQVGLWEVVVQVGLGELEVQVGLLLLFPELQDGPIGGFGPFWQHVVL